MSNLKATFLIPNGRPMAKLPIIMGEMTSNNRRSLADSPRLTNSQRVDSRSTCPPRGDGEDWKTGAAALH